MIVYAGLLVFDRLLVFMRAPMCFVCRLGGREGWWVGEMSLER